LGTASLHYIIGRASATILSLCVLFWGDLIKAQEATVDSSAAVSVRAGEAKFITRVDSSSRIYFFEKSDSSSHVATDSAGFDSSQAGVTSTSAAPTAAGDEPTAVAAITWRIMPLGDSITRGHFNAGSSPEGGYRDDLASMLSAAGVAYNFVGSLRTGAGFDREHEGHSGQTADYIDANVTSYLQARTADVVLLHIGTNDISNDEPPASTADEISSIVDKIRNFDPEIRVILCSILPRKDTRDAQNSALALLVEEIYYEKRAAGFPIFYAGQNEIFKFNPNYKTAYLYDSVHPNNTGYNVLAQVFLNTLLTALTNDDAFITDNFDRSTLGITWVTDQEFTIANKELKNTGTSPSWNYLAVHAAQANPTEASIRWSAGAETGAVRQGGLALRLNSAATNASGYLAYIDDSAVLQLWTIDGGQRSQLAQSLASALPAPLPGDIFRVNLSTDGNGHHFDYYLNDQFAGRLTDPAKQEGNGARQFAGVLLRGNANNPVDDFLLNRTVQQAIPTLTLTSPNGGESLVMGNNHNITWNSTGSLGNVKLEYSIDDGGNWTTIIASTPNDGSQSWTVPDAVSTQCLVRLSDAADGDPSDVSNTVFAIITPLPATVTLTSPIGGESLVVGRGHNITWSSTGSLGNVKLEYSIDNGGSWTTISSSTSNDGSHTWTIPNAPSSHALVRISDAADNDPQDASNSVFSITSPPANQYAMQFDGVDDYAQISDNALLSGGAGKNLTVEAWVKPQTVSGTRPIVHKYLDGNTKDWGFAIFDGTVESAIESGGDNWELSGGAVAAGVWTHIALVFDNSANVVRLYVNGVQATQKTLSKDMPDSNAPIRIGRHGYGSDYFSGEMEEIRVWNTARSVSQIAAAMNGQLLGNEAGLIGYWPFNEGSGQTAEDGTSNNSDGRLGSASSSDNADPIWVSSTAPPGPVISTLTLSSPNGGEGWEVGSIRSITWSSQGSVTNVKLEYSTTNGASWTTIVASTTNDGNHSWTVPDAVSNQCFVRVSDAADGDPTDVSNAVFSIITAPQPPAITSFTPASGEVGGQVTITGSNFVAVSSVAFNGTASGSFIVNSATQILATIPSSATTGKISVITLGGAAQSANNFTVNVVSTSFTFIPTHDTYVKASSATTSFGSSTNLRLRKTSSETINSYMKFSVTGLANAVQSAKLRLYVTEPSSNGGEVYAVSDNYKGTSSTWVEEGLNWNNAPDISGTALSSSGVVSLDAWVEFDVTPAISGNGTFSFGFKSNSTDLVWYASKEATNKPELIIETSSATAPAKSLEVVDSQTEPEDFALIRNYPNPFNGQTIIEYSLPEPSYVRINIYNALGQLVRKLVDENEAAGTQRIIWEGKDSFGQSVGSGIYFYELQAGAQRLSAKMILQQ